MKKLMATIILKYIVVHTR